MKNYSIQQTVTNTVEQWEQSESFLFTRGYKKEARLLRKAAVLLIDALHTLQGNQEETLLELITINSMQNMILNGNDLLLSIMTLEVNKNL